MLHLFQNPGVRLDSSETLFVKRELEFVDTTVYRNLYAALLMRTLVPTQAGIPEWAKVYTWSEMDEVGAAKVVSQAGEDLPRADVSKRQNSKFIKMIGSSYGYDWDEMALAAAMGTHLDTERANITRFAIELQIDSILAYGLATHNLEGLLTMSGTTAFTPSTKAAGGTAWGTLAAPNATGLEIANDLIAIATQAHTVSNGRILKSDIVLPIDQYAVAAGTKVSAFGETTALQYALSTCPFINSITPLWRAKAALSGGALSIDTMIAYPKDPMYISGIVPMEYRTLPVQQKNLDFVVPAFAKCGGTVSRYAFLVQKNNAAI